MTAWGQHGWSPEHELPSPAVPSRPGHSVTACIALTAVVFGAILEKSKRPVGRFFHSTGEGQHEGRDPPSPALLIVGPQPERRPPGYQTARSLVISSTQFGHAADTAIWWPWCAVCGGLVSWVNAESVGFQRIPSEGHAREENMPPGIGPLSCLTRQDNPHAIVRPASPPRSPQTGVDRLALSQAGQHGRR